jgi:hypothetical protein
VSGSFPIKAPHPHPIIVANLPKTEVVAPRANKMKARIYYPTRLVSSTLGHSERLISGGLGARSYCKSEGQSGVIAHLPLQPEGVG